MSFFWREYVYRLPGVRRVTRVNFRGGSVRQSLWIKSAAPVLTFTIVVNYSEFFPRRFIPTVVAASRSYPPPPPSVYSFSFLLSLLASLFFFYSTFPSPLSSVSSSTVPQRLHPPKDARHRRVIERLVHRIDDDDSLLNYTRSRGLRDALFGKFYGVTCSLGCTNNEG